MTIGRSVQIVEGGHVKVLYQFGRISGQVEEGFNLVAPWMDTKEANIQVQRNIFEKLNAFSEETQDVFIDATLNYQISPLAVQQLYRNIGVDWFDRLVVPRVHQLFKDETVKYKSVNIAPNRENIRANVRARLTTEMEQFSITIVDLLIENIDFNPDFKHAIEAKQIATQDALREEQKIAGQRNMAAQRVEEAKGEAQQRVIRATAEATAIVAVAEAQAEANALINASLTDKVIQYALVQKLGDDIRVIVLPSGQEFILGEEVLGKNIGEVAPDKKGE